MLIAKSLFDSVTKSEDQNHSLFQSHTLSHTATLLRSTKMLKLVVAAVMLHVAASKPRDVNVEVTVNGVKIPINLDKPENSKTGLRPFGVSWAGQPGQYFDWYKKAKFNPNLLQQTPRASLKPTDQIDFDLNKSIQKEIFNVCRT